MRTATKMRLTLGAMLLLWLVVVSLVNRLPDVAPERLSGPAPEPASRDVAAVERSGRDTPEASPAPARQPLAPTGGRKPPAAAGRAEPPRGTVLGRIVGADGRAAFPYVVLESADEDARPRRRMKACDLEGFSFSDVPPGEYRLLVRPREWALEVHLGDVVVRPGERVVHDARLPDAWSVGFVAVNDVPADAVLRFRSHGTKLWQALPAIEPGRSWRSLPLPRGSYEVRFEGPSALPVVQEFAVDGEPSEPIEVRYRGGVPFLLCLQGFDKRRAADLVVRSADGEVEVRIEHGRFHHLPHMVMPLGPIRVELTPSGSDGPPLRGTGTVAERSPFESVLVHVR